MRALVIDTNLMLLLLAGSVAPNLIGNHKRLRAFSGDDLSLLLRLISGVERVLVTPHILTETSNFIGQFHEPHRTALRIALREIVNKATEHSVTSRELMRHDAFPALGLTDAAIMSLPDANYAILTADLDLWAACKKGGIEAHNFNHIRQLQG